jgi:hypothetical protein
VIFLSQGEVFSTPPDFAANLSSLLPAADYFELVVLEIRL